MMGFSLLTLVMSDVILKGNKRAFILAVFVCRYHGLVERGRRRQFRSHSQGPSQVGRSGELGFCYLNLLPKYLVQKEIEYKLMSVEEKRQLVAEVNILRMLKHPNIVRYIERILDKKQCLIYIVMEYCLGGDLATVIKQSQVSKDFIQEDFIWSVLAQISSALNECHKLGILHRDIKPEVSLVYLMF